MDAGAEREMPDRVAVGAKDIRVFVLARVTVGCTPCQQHQ
ncbi:Uncharacterised protein [Mycobacterium tuberculosis]|uniref:Uncharacterized protein n=1 Tax=Mycobacterium tuberculosis TaxID=1773 RepID=A0A916LD71_MYCTX|nr:Uncharacterised protein [Mycobacterium tuberculosis]COY15006.1 Uncharacterised protein [Mycobacterium tuberculosis]COY97113.1 Uncharacterised protein [Mycobacterium tuberculosis]